MNGFPALSAREEIVDFFIDELRGAGGAARGDVVFSCCDEGGEGEGGGGGVEAEGAGFG